MSYLAIHLQPGLCRHAGHSTAEGEDDPELPEPHARSAQEESAAKGTAEERRW